MVIFDIETVGCDKEASYSPVVITELSVSTEARDCSLAMCSCDSISSYCVKTLRICGIKCFSICSANIFVYVYRTGRMANSLEFFAISEFSFIRAISLRDGNRLESNSFKEVSVNHTLVYYNHAENGCYFAINTPKTEAGKRTIPMLDFVKDAFLQERKNNMSSGVRCQVTIDGYTDFIFVNRFGNAQHQGTLNKALRRIIRDCNDEVLLKGEKNPVLLPPFSCHNLRHTFTTRLCEAGVNLKVIQDTLGHKDIETTMEIYAEATRDLKKKEYGVMEINNDVWAI